MIALLQRVKSASVEVNNKLIAEIDRGLLVFLGIELDDNEHQADHLVDRVLTYRVFQDDQGKMNQSLKALNLSLLLVPQFTLAANTNKGLRPSFSQAAPAHKSLALFNYFINTAKEKYDRVATGQFGADMQVSLINDGPVTFWLQSR